jgi:hypothetical protein
MQTKHTERALSPKDHSTPAQTPRSEARIRPDHAAHHGRSTLRDAMMRRGTGQPRGGITMDYQQGFFSGSSS